MLEPRPEIKMPTRLRSAMMGGGPGSARAPAFGRPGDGAALLPGRNPADAEHGLARRFQFPRDPGRLGLAHYRTPADEIGRPPCRDRGCQYGKISVGAVYL